MAKDGAGGVNGWLEQPSACGAISFPSCPPPPSDITLSGTNELAWHSQMDSSTRAFFGKKCKSKLRCISNRWPKENFVNFVWFQDPNASYGEHQLLYKFKHAYFIKIREKTDTAQ
jgi:hypothetical protein